MLIINPNPCFDRTLTLGNFARGAVMRGESALLTAGGKGINVARAVRAFGGKATIGLLIGEQDLRKFESLLKAESAEYIFSTHPGIVRVATIIFESDNTTSTIINERGSDVSPKDWSNFVDQIAKRVTPGEIVACMGSFPNGVGESSVAELISAIQGAGARVIFDSSPQYLKFALKAGVDIVSPNLDEAESLLQGGSADLFTGDLEKAQERSERAAIGLLELGAQVAFVTAGAAGVAIATKSETGNVLQFLPGVTVNFVSAVGAGDSFVAGVAMQYTRYGQEKRDLDWRDIASFGIAVASASCEQSTSGGVNVARVRELYSQISARVSQGAQ